MDVAMRPEAPRAEIEQLATELNRIYLVEERLHRVDHIAVVRPRFDEHSQIVCARIFEEDSPLDKVWRRTGRPVSLPLLQLDELTLAIDELANRLVQGHPPNKAGDQSAHRLR